MGFSPGAVLHKVGRKFDHGVRTTYYREIVRPKILKTRPVGDTSSEACEVHVLTSGEDWLNLLWALKTFYHFSGRNYALAIHDDGTMPAAAAKALREHCPGARLISRQEAGAAVLPTLAGYPRCLEFRRRNKLALKVFDFLHYSRSPRIMVLDSDVLFFSEPVELLRRIEDPLYRLNSVNADVANAYTVDPADVEERFGFRMGPCFNSGLGLIHRDSLRLEWLEEFLSLPNVLSHTWRIEQTLFALSSFRSGTELLPEEYRVRLDGEITGSCKHFVGAIRHHMYDSGMRHLARSGFLRSIAA